MNHVPSRTGLPEEILPSSSWSKVRRIIGWTVLLLFLLGQLFWGLFEYYTSNFTYHIIKQKWRMVQMLQAPVDVLVLGDSAAGAAVIPEIIEQESGLRTLNLAIAQGICAISDNWLLDAYLAKFGPPKWVVLCREDLAWQNPIDGNKGLMQFPFGPLRWLTIQPRPPFSRPEWVHLIMMLVFPPLRPDVKVQHLIVLDVAPKRIAMTNSGTVVMWGVNPAFMAGLPEASPDESKIHHFMTPPSANSLQYTLSRARQEKFHLLITNPPIWDHYVQGNRAQRIAKLRLVFSNLAKQEPLVTYNDTLYRYPLWQMRDPSHVPYTTAIDYSRRLGRYLKEKEKERILKNSGE